jgi:hypothetical protein
MKYGSLVKLGLLLTACLSAANAAAQVSPAIPAAAADDLVVQVEYLKGAKPTYTTVPGGVWFGRFGWLGTPEPRPAGDTVHAVDVQTRRVGERVEIRVGVHVGERFFDRLDAVATYTAAAGETVEARELKRVGVAPFVFRVLRVNASDTAAPSVVNRTQSVAATITDFSPSPLPRARVTLHNLSQKSVRAVELRTVFNGRERTTSLASEREGKALIEPGGTYVRKIGVTDGRASAADFTPETIESVVVVSVVFDDYTYEGDAEAAARKMSYDGGERAQIPRLMSLVRATHAARDVETAEAVRRFRAGLNALDDAAPQTLLDAVAKAYPTVMPAHRGDIKDAAEVRMHRVRVELLDALAQFEAKFRAAPAENSFKGWLKQTQARYEQWLSRL